MGTGKILTKDNDGTWHSGYPLVKVENGWKRGELAYAKTGASTWTLRYNGDYDAPAAPAMRFDGTATAIGVTAPNTADVSFVVCKRSTVGYPTNWTEDGDFDKTMQSDNCYWSRWWVTPGQDRVMSLSYGAGTTIYFSAWTMDVNGNVSAVSHASVQVPVPPAPPQPVEVTRSAYADCTHSASWRSPGWRTDNNYVYQGGSYGGHSGMWFYSGRISSPLSRAIRINRISLYIQRVNSSHGISGGAILQYTAHRLQDRPGGSPSGYIQTMGQPGTLTRGQAGWFDIPSQFHDGFRTGWFVGFGLHWPETSFTDSHYQYAYGGGTASGKVYMEWVERQ